MLVGCSSPGPKRQNLLGLKLVCSAEQVGRAGPQLSLGWLLVTGPMVHPAKGCRYLHSRHAGRLLAQSCAPVVHPL